ncbi:MAG: alpha/beta fold hydrolase [Planctomycetes bacterium]|nr:alpha/beta fold hydrolase [Planctomycetota bacterium]
MAAAERIFIRSGDHRLESLLSTPADPKRGVFVLCHPYPFYGGDMFNKIVVKLTDLLLDQDFFVLRYNMAGTGKSTGSMQEPPDARRDLEEVCTWIADRHDLKSLWLAGYSYGAFLALSSQIKGWPGAFVPKVPLRGILSIAYPCTVPGFRLDRLPDIPLAFIHGLDDELIPAYAAAAYLRGWKMVKKVVWVKGANHSFNGKLPDLQKACRDCLPELILG